MSTLVERTTCLVLVALMNRCDADNFVGGFARNLGRIAQPLRKYLTYDQGREIARHAYWDAKRSLKTYFADPHSSWQGSSNEKASCLLRQYLPGGVNFATLSQRELNIIAERLNNRPPAKLLTGWHLTRLGTLSLAGSTGSSRSD